VQREFIRRMKRRFQERGSEIASAAHTILMQVAAQFDVQRIRSLDERLLEIQFRTDERASRLLSAVHQD
jgi:hypothetical protein